MTPRVSILIPAYNAERWIADTIASAVRQTWPVTEIIVVDDGSRDRTLPIARQFQSPTVSVVSRDHHGASAARNHALRLAQGDYIQWLDADDLLAHDKIAEQLASVRDEPETADTLLSSPFGIFYWRPRRARFVATAIWETLQPLDYLIRSFAASLWMNPASWLVSRNLTERAGPWDERLTLNDDGEYFCRVVAASRKVQFVPTAASYYRQSGAGQLSRRTDRRSLESFALSLWLSIRWLLDLEDSIRTRLAALRFLQHCAPSFSPSHMDLVAPIAETLECVIEPVRGGLRARLLGALLGPEQGRRVMASCRRAKFAAAVQWDRFLYRFDPAPLS
jgi:glycosyltransferase involved in cell wall biosynthesis